MLLGASVVAGAICVVASERGGWCESKRACVSVVVEIVLSTILSY